MKKILKRFAARGSLLLAISAALLFFGVVLACPITGLAATLPFAFCLILIASILSGSFWFSPVVGVLLALAYGFGMRAASPFFFAGEVFLTAFVSSGIVFCFKKMRKTKKRILLLPFFALILLGAILPCLVYGTPFSYLAAGKNALSYLANRYPEQDFTRVAVYRDPAASAWHCDCTYTYEGNSLSSVILFGKTTKDGFLEDRMASAQETRRSAIIEALRDGEENVLVEPDGFSEDLAAREVVLGIYGVYDTALEKDMRFCITFRREKTQKRDFALAIRDCMAILRDKGIEYDAIRFVALSAGKPVFDCTVTPTTSQNLLIDMIRKL